MEALSPVTAGKRVAIYGGSFDPPHNGHVLAVTWCACLLDEAGLARFDEVRVVPVFGHAFGKALTPFETRVAMIEDATRHLGARVVVDRIEATLPVPSYTVDTLRAMRAREPGLEATLVVGADAWAERRAWREWDELARLVDHRFVVLGRAGVPDPEGAALEVHLPGLSSTEVRRRARAGEPYWWMVPEAVAARVAREGLYR
ncbi:MAG: nicotinate-nicotinamide nucleotide adenylyltransferase [Deltaproteobacteria bacterium]|nr:nicotinate-nicotinamide nucleotide adenylyltransferase [Deltaproteobacteria bacterium]